MKTELVVGTFRIHFESRARRRWYVALIYAAVALICLAWCSFNPTVTAGTWILSGCMILGTALVIVFTSIAGDVHARADEREVCRREHAYLQAHWLFARFIVISLIADVCFRGHNPVTSLVPAALQGGMVQWPQALLIAIGLVYLSQPPGNPALERTRHGSRAGTDLLTTIASSDPISFELGCPATHVLTASQ